MTLCSKNITNTMIYAIRKYYEENGKLPKQKIITEKIMEKPLNFIENNKSYKNFAHLYPKNAIQTLYRQIIGDYQSFFALKKSTKITEAKRLAAKPPGFKHGKLFNSYFTYNDFSVKYCLNDQDVVDRKYLNSSKLKTLSNNEKLNM